MSDFKKYIRVACRLCGKEMLFPRGFYQEKDLIGWECRGSLSHSCKIAYERDKRKQKGVEVEKYRRLRGDSDDN